MDQFSSTAATSNFSSTPGPVPHLSWDSSRLVPAVMLSLCFSVGVPGNIAVIILKPNWEHLSSLSQSLMLNLAVSDLLCLLTLPVWIHNYLYSWTLSVMTCKLLAYLVYCSIYGSLLSVTGLSIQRYLVVVHRRRCHRVQIRFLLVLLWLLACALSIPALVVRQLKTNQQWTDCGAQYSSDAQWLAALMTETLFGFISFVTVAFSYIHLQRKVKQAAFFNNPQTTRLVTSIIVSLFVLWVPYQAMNVFGVAAVFLKNEGLKKFYTDTWDFVVVVTFVNSCLNPLLYAFTSTRICCFWQNKEPKQQKRDVSQTEDGTRTAGLS